MMMANLHAAAARLPADALRSARNAIAALTKRLAHRNPNVQIYALEVSGTRRWDPRMAADGDDVADGGGGAPCSLALADAALDYVARLTTHPQLTNTLAQNCGQPLLEEMSSRTWTGALSRLVNDRVG